MLVDNVLAELNSLSDPSGLEGMKRFGIETNNALGIKIPILRKLAKKYKLNHSLALELWQSRVHEARILACYIADPAQVSEDQMDSWAQDFNSWDIVDQCCGNLFDKTPFAYKKAVEWAFAKEEFVKRAGFVMMAELAAHEKKTEDQDFIGFFSVIEQEAKDDRNFVKKAVNWALRQIGKRNDTLRVNAIACAERIMNQSFKSSKWIARDALRELTNLS
jgi:3-methyladenine DNA glycosylase AlkD